MARPKENGLRYFPLDTDWMDDKKIRTMRGRYGAEGCILYLSLLSRIYDAGYAVKLDDDFYDLLSVDVGMSVRRVREAVAYMAEKELFDAELFGRGILTGKAVQRRWFEAVRDRVRKNPIEVDAESWLLGEQDGIIIPGITSVFPGKTPINPGKTPLKKRKEKKTILHTLTAREGEDAENTEKTGDFTQFSQFLKNFGISDESGAFEGAESMDFSALSAAYSRSSNFLQTAGTPRRWSFVVKYYQEILAGYYDDAGKAKGGGAASSGNRADFYRLRREKAQADADLAMERARSLPGFSEAWDKLKEEERKREPDEGVMATIRARVADILEGTGMTEADLTVRAFCPVCGDTGFTEDGSPCGCFTADRV